MKEVFYNYINNETFNDVLNYDLNHEGEEIQILSKINMTENTSSSLILNLDHSANKTKSFVKIRAVLNDSALLKIFGDIHIKNNARDCDAYFEVKVLLLGNKSHAIVLPKLRIDNRFVKAKHAVVIKKISIKDLYFFSSRGITNSLAESFIIQGFLNS